MNSRQKPRPGGCFCWILYRPPTGRTAPPPLPPPLPLPVASPNKRVLTVYSSGCAAFEHPADPRRTAPRRLTGGDFAGRIGPRRSAFGAVLTGHQADVLVDDNWCCVRHVPLATAQRLILQDRDPSRRSSAKRTCGGACHALPPRHGPEGHATTERRDPIPSLPQQRRVAERRLFPFGSLRKCADGPSFQPQSGRFPVAPSCAAQVATKDGRAPAGRHENIQCPTRCSSMRPIRRRPG
jgi:hypothetical protein